MSIGEKLKELREGRALNKKEIARILDMPYTTYNNYETNQREPGSETLLKVAKFYEVTVDFILGNPITFANNATGAAPSDSRIADSIADSLTREQREYVEKYFALYLEGRERVHAIINFEFSKQQGEKKAVTGITQPSNVIEFPQETVVLLEPSLPVCAGMGNYLDDNIQWEERTVLKNKYTYGADYIVKLQGDSMEPEFHDGDRLIVTDARGQRPINGRVGIFIINGDAFFRQPLADVLHPYNPNYKDIIPTESDDVKYVGYVVGIIDDSWIINKHEAV